MTKRFFPIASVTWMVLLLSLSAGGTMLPSEGEARVFSGFSVGHARGTNEFGGNLRHDFVHLNAHVGRVLPANRVGCWHLLGEVNLARRHNPQRGWIGGVTPLARHAFDLGNGWSPFVEGGVGLQWSGIGQPDLSGKLQFAPTGGIGFYRFTGQEWAFTGQYRFIHYSNGGTSSPNSGINVHAVLFGLSRFR